MEEEFSASHEVHDQVKFFLCLERVMKLDNEIAVHVFKDFSFCFCMYSLISLLDFGLLEDLHGIKLFY